MSEPASRLPERPSLAQLRKQAKELLRDLRAGGQDAADRFRAIDPRFVDAAPSREATLVQAQLVVAREYGFDSWAVLVRHVETVLMRDYERLADRLAHAYTAGDRDAVREINAAYATSFWWDWEPHDMQQRLTTWFASSTRTMDLARADARRLVARQLGFDDWDELVGTASGRSTVRATAPFYRIDDERRTIETHGPVSDRDWDTVFRVIEELGLTGLKAGGQMTDTALARLASLDQLTHIDISGSNGVTDDGLQHIARLSQLEDLSLGGWDSGITDRGLRVLSHLSELRAFRMGWHRRVSDAGLSHLTHCAHLTTVDLMGTSTGDGGIAVLAGKRDLRWLRAGQGVTAGGLSALHDIPSFKNWHRGEATFTLMGGEIGPTFLLLPQQTFADGGTDALAGLDGLFGLGFFAKGASGGGAMTGRGLAPLVHLDNLGWLACDPSDDGMRHIAALPRLRMLSCQDTNAGDDGFVALGQSQSLECIWGSNARGLAGRGFTALSAMPSLRGLAMHLRGVDDAALARLRDFPALTELAPMGLTDDAFRHVGQCTNLQRLWLMYCDDTGDAATAHIAGLRRLATYYATSTKITDRSLALLAAMTSLEEISLSDCQRITNDGVVGLSTLPQLRRLTLEGVPGVSRAALRAFGTGVDASLR